MAHPPGPEPAAPQACWPSIHLPTQTSSPPGSAHSSGPPTCFCLSCGACGPGPCLWVSMPPSSRTELQSHHHHATHGSLYQTMTIAVRTCHRLTLIQKLKTKERKAFSWPLSPQSPAPSTQHLHQRLLKGTSHLPGPGNPKPSTEPQQGPHNPAQPVPAAAPTPSWSPQLAPAACHRAQWPPASWGHWHCPPCTPADLAP